MALPKIDKLSYAELLELQTRTGEAIEAKRAEEQAAIREQAAKLAAEAGFSLDEIVSTKGMDRRRGKAAAKYRNPKNASQTWTGRGRKPNWLVAELETGRKLDTFEI
jgi:DNA-binding protein H-NS